MDNNDNKSVLSDVENKQLTEEQRLALKREAYKSPLNEANSAGKIELLEERAVVDKERIDVGKIIATKKVRSKTINVPVELVEEVLVVETKHFDDESKQVLEGFYGDDESVRRIEPTLNNGTSITINGKKITLGDDPVEVVLSRQVAKVTTDTYVVQEVNIEKTQHTHKEQIEVSLQREELDVIEEGFLDHKDTKR